MNVREAIEKRRSIRRFSPQPVEINDLYEMVGAARLAPQAANVQPMKYMIVHQKELVKRFFDCTKWAGYLPGYTPSEGLRPTAYILCLIDQDLKMTWSDTDAGAAVENMILTAVEKGLGTCWLGALNKEKLTKLLGVPENLKIHSAVAVGYPAQEPCWEEKDGDSIKYYLDDNDRIHVPKRRMNEILVEIHPDLEA